jgi:TonB family protein
MTPFLVARRFPEKPPTHHPMPHRLLSSLAAALLLCLAHVPSAEAQERPGRDCDYTISLDLLPAPAAVLDTAGMKAAMTLLEPESHGREHRFWVLWDSLGQPDTATYDGTDGRSAEGDALAGVILARMLPTEPILERAGSGRGARMRPREWSARLVVKEDGSLSLTPAIECRPRLLNGAEVVRALHRLVEPVPTAAPPEEQRWTPTRMRWVTLRMRIGPDGRVLEGIVAQRSGDARLDRQVFERFREVARFAPATVDGRPVAVWVDAPLEIEGPQ